MKITVLDGYALNPGDNPWDSVSRLGEFDCHDRTDPREVVARAKDADILLTNKTPITAASIAALPKLKFIGVLATGYNIVDVKAARARGIPVSNIPIYGTDTVAEYVISLMLNFYRQPQLHSELVKRGEWGKAGDWSFWRTPQSEAAGRTLGIVGFGRIGRRLGELAAAFKMKVLANDVYHGNPPSYAFEWREIPDLFAQSDVISLHCNLTPENTGMVNESLIARMKPGGYLINTSRGPLVNEPDLAKALRDRRIAGAALDVVCEEPVPDDSPLLGAPNLTMTPHMAWAALEARKRLMQVTAENIAAFLEGKPIHVVN